MHRSLCQHLKQAGNKVEINSESSCRVATTGIVVLICLRELDSSDCRNANKDWRRCICQSIFHLWYEFYNTQNVPTKIHYRIISIWKFAVESEMLHSSHLFVIRSPFDRSSPAFRTTDLCLACVSVELIWVQFPFHRT